MEKSRYQTCPQWRSPAQASISPQGPQHLKKYPKISLKKFLAQETRLVLRISELRSRHYGNIFYILELKNIARVRNCPDVTTLDSFFGLCLLSFCLFVFLSFCIFVFLSFRLFVFLSFCLFDFLSFCLFVFLSRHQADQMSERSQVSKVTLCVKIQKWQWLTQWVTKVRYRAARAAKNTLYEVIGTPFGMNIEGVHPLHVWYAIGLAKRPSE